MARWVTVHEDAFPFNYRVKATGAWLHFKADELDNSGERLVPDDQADFIVKTGRGIEGRRKDSTTRSRKGKTTKRKPAKKAPDAKAPDTRPDSSVADEAVVEAGSTGDRNSLDQTAS